MNNETVYIKIAQITEVYKPEVFLSDIAEVYCQNLNIEAKVKAIKIFSFQGECHKQKTNSQSVYGYVGNVVDLIKKIETFHPNVQVNNLGEVDYVVKYRPGKRKSAFFQWLKAAGVSVIAFCGSAFAIMTFNNDANVTDVFSRIYYLITGVPSNGRTILEFSYSLGLTVGIIVFFNHFAKWKLTVDPTPIEVEMRLYEENSNKTLIQNTERKEKRIDVS